ncbi:RAD3-like DNA-binding helicase protein [Actinidia rufa]|uniref:RAD3-like DNA-binding helicase protein n=1 Tax=Actinidia rufa TaxID=165716 RepID=A0A7J0GIG4_9ERIC|nr:RAD3-like DNA-binding helicase protein [Actinidia rufa]
MDSSTPMRNPKKNSHHIGGIAVEFPYQPYGSQMAFKGSHIYAGPCSKRRPLPRLASVADWYREVAVASLLGSRLPEELPIKESSQRSRSLKVYSRGEDRSTRSQRRIYSRNAAFKFNLSLSLSKHKPQFEALYCYCSSVSLALPLFR